MLTDLLRKLREAHNLTQEDVAKHLNIQRTTYTRYETGTNSLNFDALSRLADLYKVSTDYLLGRSPLNKVQINPELISLYKNCDPVYRDIAVDILRKGQRDSEQTLIQREPCVPLLNQSATVLPLSFFEESKPVHPTQEDIKVGVGDYVYTAEDDSMKDVHVEAGDYVIIRPQSAVASGETALVYWKGKTFLRRVFETAERIALVPANDAYEIEFCESDGELYFLGRMLGVIKPH